MSATREERQHRVEVANAMIECIANHGRGFFRYKNRAGHFGLDHRGHLFFRDAFSQRDTFIRRGWKNTRGVTEGGTMMALMDDLARFIRTGEAIRAGHFGPWPDWYCGGDLWGYGEDMERVRLAARLLGIVEEDSHEPNQD